MTNEKADTLKGISIPEGTDKEARKETLVEKTKMNAETVTFYVKPEKLDSYESNVTYATCTNIPYDKIKTRTYNVKNIDMGIEYRPEAEISLNKEIKTIELVTSDSEKIMKVAFKDIIDSDGKKKLNEECSNGIIRIILDPRIKEARENHLADIIQKSSVDSDDSKTDNLHEK